MSVVFTWFQSGWVAFGAIAFLWAEFALVCYLSAAPGLRFRLLLANVLAGSCLLAALGFALRDGVLPWVPVFLSLALIAHVWDVAARLRGQSASLRRKTEKLSRPAIVTHTR
ncbi:hypothetical protein [Nitratireductor alexandrii]|uniref:hypothetical protein n=1 Tax=Nitratireductor alexandrii TaxID=2448161 RepID=UPI000FDA1CBE|nr:hypothetical protein [Nitratireductor alexandrii]